MTNGRRWWRRSPWALAAMSGVLMAAGAGSAVAGFLPWWLAMLLGLLSGVATTVGTALWERHAAGVARREAWAAAVAVGPGPDEAAHGNSVLAALNPEQRVVGFNRLRDGELRGLLGWSRGTLSDERPVRLVSGAPGSGKTRLLVECADRLAAGGVVCGWVRRDRGAAAVAAAAAWGRPVVLFVDDAETRPDLPALLLALTAGDADVRVVLAAREFGEWWARLRAGLPRETARALPPADGVVLGPLVTTGPDQEQLFAQAGRYFARRFGTAPPAATLAPPHQPAQLLMLHAAAAVATLGGQPGPVTVDAGVRQLFADEESWWERSAAAAGLTLSRAGLRSAIVAATVLGARGLDEAVALLGHFPGLPRRNPDAMRRLAEWLREVYPQRADTWLDPHLPARLVERYVADQLAASPPLRAAVVAAALAPTP
ncbi:P-loop NTPase [Streptomyces mayteni]